MKLSDARRFQDLLNPEVVDSKYQYDRMFSDKSFVTRRLSKKKFKILRSIDPLLQNLLYEDESVDFVTSGIQASFWDAYFLGWIMYYLNRTAIVFTTHRILMIRIDRKRRPRDLLRQIRYEAIGSVNRTWTGHTKMILKDKRTYKFSKLPKRDHAFMADTFKELVGQADLADSGVVSMEDLCPHCGDPVSNRPLKCPYCGGGFKSSKRAATLSLVFPGLGDWYLGHKGFAVLEMTGAALLWLSFWLPPIDEAGNELPYPEAAELLLSAARYFAIMHGLDAVVTARIARAGLYPTGVNPLNTRGLAARVGRIDAETM